MKKFCKCWEKSQVYGDVIKKKIWVCGVHFETHRSFHSVTEGTVE